MLDAIGETLPLAVAIAFSPLAIVAVVVLLLSDRPRAASLGFLLGWVAGVGILAVAGYLLASLIPTRSDATVTPIVLLVIGVGCIALFVRQWSGRPGVDDDVEAPRWMARVTGMTGLTSFIFGVLFGGAKPKNFLLALGAGVSVEAAGVVGGEAVGSLLVFVVVSSLSILTPVVLSITMGERARQPLETLREWMTRHNSAMVAVILLLVGAVLRGSVRRGFGG